MKTKHRNLRLTLLTAVSTVVLPPLSFGQSLPDPTRPFGMQLQNGQKNNLIAPVLQSVMIAPKKRTAIINGQAVTLGGMVGDAKVIQIDENEVKLAQGKEIQVLKLYAGMESPVRSIAPVNYAANSAAKTK